MSYLYDDFIWKIIYKVLSREKHLNIVIDKDKQNAESIDEKVVNNILNEKYMNGSHLDILKSMFNMILLHHVEDPSGNEEFNLPYLDPSILNLLTSFKLASLKDTSEGYAMLSNFKSINDMVIVKTSKTRKDNKGILFEYFIGTIGINKLRTLIPNFAYTLAIFKCNPLPISADKKIDVKRFCKEESSDTRFYVVYEKIKGISMDDFVHSMVDDNDVHRLLTYIIQIAFALIIAQREIGYVHYDLHTDNIILRQLPSPKVIEYDIDGKTYRVETDAIPTIIDYGFSHFVYQGIPVGGKTMPDLGIIPTLTSKGFDLYKFIMYIMNGSFKKKGINFFNKISWIIDYFKNDPFGIYDAYKNKIYTLNAAFGVGWRKFYNVTPNSPIYHDHPMNFLTWLSHINKPLWEKSVKVSDSVYNIPSNDIIESYRAKIEGMRIFNSHIMDNLDNCNILDTDHKSYIINSYVSHEFSKILDTFGNHIKNPHLIKKKIKLLSDKSEKNRYQYHQNDLSLLTIYTDELLAIQELISLDIYEKKLNEIKTILEIKRLNSNMKILQSYIETYINYRIFVDYSKTSSKLTTDEIIDVYKSRAISIYKKFEQIKSEYIFETLRKNLDIINSYVYNKKYEYTDYYSWKIDYTFTDALKTIQYVIADIRLFYPEIEYAYKDIENLIYKIVSDLVKRRVIVYVPPRSGIQFNIASNCSADELDYILFKNFKPREMSILSFINLISLEKMKDDEVYNLLNTKFDKISYPFITRHFKFLLENAIYNRIKMEKINCLDIGSPIMEKYHTDILEILNVSEKDLITVDLANTGKKFVNILDVNPTGKFPFPSDHFSIITSFMVLHNIFDVTERLIELYRILKPGGLIIIREYDSGTQCQQVISDIDKILTDRRNIDTQSFYMSIIEWKILLQNMNFIFVYERLDSNLTKYLLFTK